MPKGNWVQIMAAKMKVRRAKKANVKAKKRVKEAVARENKDTQRTKDVSKQLKASGLSQKEIDKLRGKK